MRQQRQLKPEDTLSKTEAATFAGVTPRTIGRWIATGQLHRYVRQINRVAVSKRELTSLLAGRART